MDAKEIVKQAGLKTGAESVESTTDSNGMKLDVKSFDRIQTGAEAFEKAGIDPTFWRIDKVSATSWEVCAKDTDGNLVTKPLWRVAIQCSRIVSEDVVKSSESIVNRLMPLGMKLPPVRYSKKKASPVTMVLGLVDHHFGKLCWAVETGSDYDLRIAEELWAKAIDRALERAKTMNVSRIIFPIGIDLCNVDGKTLETTAGTPQDCDTRYEKMCGIAQTSLLNAIERCRQAAPTHVIFVAGNHDRTTGYWLTKVAEQAFSRYKSVTFDTSPKLVKSIQFGRCMLVFSHGDGPNQKALIATVPVEFADEWAASPACREILTGHLHQTKIVSHIGTVESAGITFRILPALCGSDAWHYSKGFSVSRKSTQTLFYDHEYGHIATFNESSESLMDS